jgi:hypothetical protein
MGTGWLHVDAAGVASDDTLEEWMKVALGFRLRRGS